MKRALSVITLLCIGVFSCKKSNQPGTPYAKQLAGTRLYQHNYSYSPAIGLPNGTDTIQATIQYINDATIEFNTYKLTYSPSESNDSVTTFEYNTPDNTLPMIRSTLWYEHNTNSVDYNFGEYSSAAGQTSSTYVSLP